MNEIDLVVFDLAGTTIQEDGKVANAFLETLRAYGLSVTEEELQSVRGTSKRDVIRHFVDRDLKNHPSGPLANEIFLALQNRLTESFGKNGGVKIMDGAKEAFAWLHERQIKIALNTGFGRTITELIVHSLDLKIIDAVVCGDDVASGRPAPYLIFHAMEATGVRNVRRVANVGDTTNDLHAGLNAGVQWNIGVWSGAHTREQLERVPHTHLLPSVASLPSLWDYF
jgi:phosphonatase-like hydrolase